MMNTFFNIFVGVFSGVLTSTLLWIALIIKKTKFNPWWENRLYKGVLLDGEWVGRRVTHLKLNEPEKTIRDELDIQMTLEQSGYAISGFFSAVSTVEKKDAQTKYQNLYKISGHIHDNYVVLEYHPISRKRTGLGTFLMEVKNGGQRMEGDITFVDEEDMDIVTLSGAILNRVEKS